MQKSKFKLYYTHNPIKEIFVMGIKLGLAGLGAFGTVFAPLFASHPLVDAIYLCDAEADKIKQNAENPAVAAKLEFSPHRIRSRCDENESQAQRMPETSCIVLHNFHYYNLFRQIFQEFLSFFC